MKAIYRNTVVCIMAGGVGSRFWPASRESKPKQFMDITGSGRSLIQQTYDRFAAILPPENILIVTYEPYKDLVREHLPDLSEHAIISEPMRRNTGPAALIGTLMASQLGTNPNIIMAPADHLIRKEEVFYKVIEDGLEFLTGHDAILTLGIEPSHAHTGYGYIHYEPGESAPYKVERFKEKPDRDTANQFLKEGNHLWNSGIFLWKASDLFDAYKKFASDLWLDLAPLKDVNPSAWEKELKHRYARIGGISIDYLIMEKATNVYTIPGTFDWSDVGNWSTLYEINEPDENGNIHLSDENIIRDCRNILVRASKGKHIIAKGLEDLLIVQDEDVILIIPRWLDQDIKQLRLEALQKFGNSKG